MATTKKSAIQGKAKPSPKPKATGKATTAKRSPKGKAATKQTAKKATAGKSPTKK